VEITLRERVLTISGQSKAEEHREGSGYYVRDRRHGSFRRSFVLCPTMSRRVREASA
jgi:HSP20 family protein